MVNHECTQRDRRQGWGILIISVALTFVFAARGGLATPSGIAIEGTGI